MFEDRLSEYLFASVVAALCAGGGIVVAVAVLSAIKLLGCGA